ncbi:hypothetical protein BIV57_00715 [Mangrovactinospora gilvigrisea]|uniref:Uncharacterized protein n=1 Tax=Mangrovactinospora gilvigrisea TaxID=1428644 RepID=A0A1J7BLD0_9ACTN|nr:hypothetical protein [Mangrovactinospora gilvigrisea]OIV39397.1 hypothetical protein BIV57_00715 [Mangrovactinospora gilvigrisea]
MATPIIVHPPDEHGSRRVDVTGIHVGRAFGRQDVEEFARRSGFENLDITDPRMVEWRGGGPEAWG